MFLQKAPKLQVEKWLNTKHNITLESLRGKVVMIVAFQMLCPGCVEFSLPQAKKVQSMFSDEDVVVIGIHTVFEHHEAMKEVSLRAFIDEYQITFPVAIDEAGDNRPLPKTMEAYDMQGTPTIILIDRDGNINTKSFGHIHNLRLGAKIASLVLRKSGEICQNEGDDAISDACNLERCT